MTLELTDEKKLQYLSGLNEALQVHGNYLQGMCFYDLQYQKERLVFLVKPTGICACDKSMQAFTDIANILTLSGETISFEIAEGLA